jgi:hypothetical protein
MMPATPAAQRETGPAPAPVATHERTTQSRRAPARPARPATDDEILGLEASPGANETAENTAETVGAGPDGIGTQEARLKPAPTNSADGDSLAEPENLRPVFDANPELRAAWQDAQAYRETFATPEEARAATALLADLDRMDALFFSRKPEDHAELARAVATLDPQAFASLAQAMNGLATEAQRHRENPAGNTTAEPSSVGSRPATAGAKGTHAVPGAAPATGSQVHDLAHAAAPPNSNVSRSNDAGHSGAVPLQTQTPTAAQAEFFHATNAAAVESVVDAIESQVERLLPEGVSKTARNRVVGEIYRELDTTLRSNRQLAQQMRDAFKSGALDADHQRAIVSLIAGRARQALPGVAKRVLNEWTSTVVAANQDRRARQRAAERRIDIAGSGGAGNDGHRSLGPREIDYARMSDADILNL